MDEEQANEVKEAMKEYMKTPSSVEYMREMARLCDKKKDGYGFYIYVYNSGDGGSRNEHLPMHAHVLTQIKPDIDVGSFDLTNPNPPATGNDVVDADKKHPLPADIKDKVAEWAKKKNRKYTDKTNWEVARIEFEFNNPDLFP